MHNFDHSTVWGKYKVQVIEYPGENYFKVGFESKYPIQNVQILDGSRKNSVIYNKNLNDIKKYSDKVSYTFKPIYKLVLKADISGEIQPSIIPLYKEAKVKYK